MQPDLTLSAAAKAAPTGERCGKPWPLVFRPSLGFNKLGDELPRSAVEKARDRLGQAC